MADSIDVFNPSGQLVSIPVDQLQQAEKFGYKVATPDDIKTEQMRLDYGGLGNEALAAVSGVAKGATFGLSDIALASLGADDALKAYDTLYGTQRGAGEIVGAIAPMLFTGGTGAAARGAVGAAEAARAAEAAAAGARAAEAVSTGRGIASAIGKGLTAIPRAADTAGAALQTGLGLANRPIIGGAVRMATAGAIENSIQAAGNEAARLAVDNELAGEKMGQIFIEALKGGGVGFAGGGVLGTLGGGIGAAISKTGDKLRALGYGATSEAAEALAGRPGMREQALRFLSKVKNADESVGARLAADAEALKAARLADDYIEKPVERITNELTDYASRGDRLSPFGRSSEKKFEAAAHLMPRGQGIDADGTPFSWADRQVAEFERIVNPIESDIQRITDKANRFEFNQIEALPLQKRIDKARAKIAAAAEDERGIIAAQEMNSLKQTIDNRSLSLSRSKNIRAQNTAPVWKEWGTALRNSLEDEAVFGGTAAFQRGVNDGLEKMLDVNKYIRRDFLTEFKKSKVDWTRQDYVAASSKIRDVFKNTSEYGVNVPVQSLKEGLEGDKEWLTILLRDGRLGAADRKLAQDQLDAIPRILKDMGEARTIAEGGAWYKKVSGTGDPLIAAVAGGAALGPAGLLLAPIVRPQIALRGLELADKVVRGETGKIGAAVSRATTKIGQKASRIPSRIPVAAEKAREFERQKSLAAQITQQAPAIRAAISRQTGWIGQTAPKMQAVGADTVIRGAEYLNRMAPGGSSSSIPFSKPIPPTKQEMVHHNQ